MKLFLYVSISIIGISFFSQAGALDTRAVSAYETFQTAIESRYSPERREQILHSLQEKLLDYSYESHSSSKQAVIQDIIALNNEALYLSWKQEALAHTQQKILEQKYILALEKELETVTLSSNYSSLLSQERRFIPTNTSGEFVQAGAVIKLQYEKYFPVTSSTLESLKKKQGVIIASEAGTYRFIENYTQETKIPYSELETSLAGFFIKDFRIIEKNNTYYGYIFEKYKFYEDTYGAYESQLENSGFEKDTTFLYRNEEGKYNFVVEYTQRELAKAEDMFGLSHKERFLEYMLSDSKHLSSDISKNMKAIKELTLTLPKGKNPDETLGYIYQWILDNISYTNIVSLQDTRMFSAGEAFQVKNGVCTSYAKLMSYMLLYRNLYDVEMIEGYVIDAADFPKIGHAWVRVGTVYYDPTFDDPIGATISKTKEEYRFFALPQDIFYANRFHYEDLPESFKTASSLQISQYIFNTLSNLLNVYGDRAYDYLVFAPVKFRNTYNISANTLLTPELLATKLGNYKVEDGSFRFEKDGKTVSISAIRYYTITSQNTQGVLDTLNYDIADMTLFDWELADGTREWRLAYELTTR